MRPARRAVCAGWLAALFACPAVATAASVVVETTCGKYGCSESLVYSAAPGERNDVTVAQEGDLISVSDTAGLEPGTGCEALDALSARCAFALEGPNRSARFKLRDHADELDARALATAIGPIDGGAGDDRLVGPEPTAAIFVGGPGDDEMTGGPHPDRFESNRRDGSDMMAGGGPPPLLDADFFPGYDDVFYGRSRPVRVVHDGRPNDGARGEEDNLVSIEGVSTGAGDDVVIGTAGAEYMFGGAGRDLLRGGGGPDRLIGGDRIVRRRDIPLGSADRLVGGPGPDVLDGEGGRDLLEGSSGRDTLDGGRGRDRIRSGDSDRDWVLCGRGFDRVAASTGDVLMRGCERRQGARSTAEGIVLWRFGLYAVSLIVACPVAASEDCAGTVTLAVPGRPQAAAPYSVRPGMAADVALPLEAPDLDDAARKLSGAVASTANDSARFGELPDWPTDSFLDALGVPNR
jgi:RTX calcium-binding nonapeptide repeat (4 copies)